MNYSWCHDDLACSKQLQLRNRWNLLSTPLIIRPSTGHIFVSRTVDCLSWIHSFLRDTDNYYSWQTFFTDSKHFFFNYTLTFSKVYHFQFRLLLPWIRYSLDQLAEMIYHTHGFLFVGNMFLGYTPTRWSFGALKNFHIRRGYFQWEYSY